MIPTNLIENALSLTGKTMEDIQDPYIIYDDDYSIDKFCYYLLSPEFIVKYREVIADFYDFDKSHMSIERFAKAIWYYQSWNPEPLISLLEKIWQQKK